MHRIALTAILCAGLLQGCSNTASNLLSTGSILASGDQEKPAQDSAERITPLDRALQVAAVSARAQKCGFVFDPAKLRQDYLASEAASELAPDKLANLTKAYGFAQAKIAKQISGVDSYCSSARTAMIKADLNRHLTGDYKPRVEKKAQTAKWWEGDTVEGREKLNPRWIAGEPDAPTTVTVDE